MSVADFAGLLQREPRFATHITHVREIPRKEAVMVEPPADLPGCLAGYLDRKSMSLYCHQSEALHAFRRGENLLLRTPTASGKTLAFTLPVAEELFHDQNACALFLYPTKALANDQLQALLDFEKETGIQMHPALYDGDTPREKRPVIRNRSRIILTNPFELHQVLSWHNLFGRFFQNLSAVIIDEAHRYRGVPGSNMAFLVRRLRRICNRYGSAPRFILASATIGNPEEFAGRLTGLPMTVISCDGAPSGHKRFVFYNPSKTGRSAHTEAAELLCEGMRHGLQTICFSGSRRMAELVSRWARERAGQDGSLGRGVPVVAYRAGYLPGERRALEESLRNGEIRGVVSTNALELGIDIGGLDTVIMAGYPGTLMSAWQQAGRAGRRDRDSLAILIGNPNPLDQFFLHHPERFFGDSCEYATIDLKNPYILSSQVLCAAAEMPFVPERDQVYFGPDCQAILSAHEKENLLKKTGRGFVYSGRKRPSEFVSMGGGSGEVFLVVCGGSVLESLDRVQAFREAHPGAVLLHQGRQFLVRDLDIQGRVITVEPVEVDYYTKPLFVEEVRIKRTREIRQVCGVSLHFGDVLVQGRITGYKKILDGTTIGTESLDLPGMEFHTVALWFTVPQPMAACAPGPGELHGGIHGLEHALIAMFPFIVLCDRWDIGGYSIAASPDDGEPSVYIYDGYEGGIGLAECAYHHFEDLVRATNELVSGCDCESGCPSCIYSPKCGNDNQPLNKAATLSLLSWMDRDCPCKEAPC